MDFLCWVARETDRELIYDRFLLFEHQHSKLPFTAAIMGQDIDLAKCLLELEKDYAGPWRSIDDQASSDTFASLQWSFVPSYGSRFTQSALHTAVTHCQKNELILLLETARPHDVQVKDESGRNALHKAAIIGRIESLAVLVDFGVDMNAKDRYGCPPAWYAGPNVPAKPRNNEIFEFFRAKGALLVADESAKPHEGDTNRLATFSSKDMPADAVRDDNYGEWLFAP